MEVSSMVSEQLLAERRVLVTGGAQGIGRAICELFLQAGARVMAVDCDGDALQTMAQSLDEERLSTRCIDVEKSEQLPGLMSELERQWGGLDVLVNNVGGFLGLVKPLEQMSDEDIDRLYSVNLRQIMCVTRDAIPLLKRGNAQSIIAISSIEGFRAMPNISPYGAFKQAINGLVRSLALELGEYGIRVNAIAPETTETAHVAPSQWMSDEDYQRQSQWIPLGRFGRPEDSAGCALFLASNLSQWVTGTTIHCDGGALAAAGWYRNGKGQWTNTPIVDRGALDSLMPD